MKMVQWHKRHFHQLQALVSALAPAELVSGLELASV
jgi:hypothetical protein